MKKIVYLAICFGLLQPIFAQTEQSENLFTSAIGAHYKAYAQKADFAYQTKNYSTAEALFTKFIDSNVVNTKFNNFKARKLNESIIRIDTYFKKPIVLITYASWCVRTEQEILNINNLAKELHDNIDIVILFWDDLNTARKSAKDFNKHVQVLYINERENIFSKEVRTLKQTLGYPLTLYIGNDTKIVDVSKKTFIQQPTQKNSYKNSLNTLLIQANMTNLGIAKQ